MATTNVSAAEATAPSAESTVEIRELALSLANEALCQISDISRALGRYLSLNETTGETTAVAAALLQRIEALSGAASASLDEQGPLTRVCDVVNLVGADHGRR